MAGTDMGFGVWSGGHADVIRWGHNNELAAWESWDELLLDNDTD